MADVTRETFAYYLSEAENGICKIPRRVADDMARGYARLQEQLEAVTRELNVVAGQRDYAIKSNEANYHRALAAEARAARLEAALRRISDMCPATQEMSVAHMMADEAEAALDVKEAG